MPSDIFIVTDVLLVDAEHDGRITSHVINEVASDVHGGSRTLIKHELSFCIFEFFGILRCFRILDNFDFAINFEV